MTTLQKITSIWRHIEEVQKNCFIIAENLIENGEEELARQLLTNSLIHDQSKFRGIEWEYMQTDDDSDEAVDKLRLSVHQHNTTNPHHPEYWNGIHKMPDVYIAEMVADWKARSSDFGTSLQEWIDNQAAIRFHYNKKQMIYKKIMRFTKLLLEKPFHQ